jgi:hypothetical protein
VDVVTWLLSRGKQRLGSAVQGNATPWYCQTAGDLNDLPARGVHGVAQRYWPSTCPRSRSPVSAMEPGRRRSQGWICRADEVNK